MPCRPQDLVSAKHTTPSGVPSNSPHFDPLLRSKRKVSSYDSLANSKDQSMKFLETLKNIIALLAIAIRLDDQRVRLLCIEARKHELMM